MNRINSGNGGKCTSDRAAPTASAPDTVERRVLIVDDEKSIRLTLSEFLRNAGYAVDTAECSEEAMAIIRERNYAVVVVDLIMPRIPGTVLMANIHGADPRAKIIVMTGGPSLDTAIEAVRTGATDYMIKPITKAAIIHSVGKAMSLRQLEEDKIRLETENLAYQKNLEELVEQRTLELQDAMKRLKNAQHGLIQQERWNALGQMASGVAHDFNNVLMPILGFSDMLIRDESAWENREEVVNILETIRSAAEDARHIVRRLRQIYKADESNHKPVDLAKVVESAISITMPKWKEEMNARGHTIVIKTDLDTVPPVEGNAAELREALVNLILNSVDAMPTGGTMSFALHREQERDILLEVGDTGKGMDNWVLRHCFEPFFTTKGQQGTGLGLAVTRGIITRHHGKIEIDSSPGKGATFRIHFHLSSQKEASGAEDQDDAPPPNKYRILVIDDEERARKLLLHLLQADGHSVTVVSSGHEGLELCDKCAFDLVITDRAMPLISGDEVAEQIQQTRPSVPVIMLTGFGDIMVDNNELPRGVTCVLSKPVTSNDLRRAIRQAMDDS